MPGVAVAVAVTLTVSLASAAEAPMRPAGEVGTLQTLAGPGFCRARAVADPASTTVRALAVDATGRFFVDTGPPGEGLVARVDGGEAVLIPTGVAVGGDPTARGPAEIDPPLAFPASRLASDGAGGVVMGADTFLLHVAERAGPAAVAGRPREAGQAAAGDGDGGPAVDARFSRITGVATDDAGNAYVADHFDDGPGFRIRFVNRSQTPRTFYGGTPEEVVVEPGAIDTIAGVAGGDAGDGESARRTAFEGESGALAVAGDRLYVATEVSDDGGTVRMVNLGDVPVETHGDDAAVGAVVTVAGGNGPGFAGDDGPARAASFGYLPGIAADAQGNLYLADRSHHRIRKVDTAGVVTTFAGTGGEESSEGGFNGNRIPATQALLDQPFDVGVGPAGRVYIADGANGQVRTVDEAGIIDLAPGAGVGLRWACDDPGGTSQVGAAAGNPSAVAADDGGNTYFLLSSDPVIKRVDPSGVVTTVAGAGKGPCPEEPCPSADADSAMAVALDDPRALATSPAGGLYVLEAARVRVVNAGARVLEAHGVVVAPGAIATVIGATTGGADVGTPTAPAAEIAGGGSLAVDGFGNLLVADAADRSVRLVAPDGGVSTVVEASQAGLGALFTPTDLTTDAAGNIYVLDSSPLPSGDELSFFRVWFLNRGPEPRRVHGQVVEPGALAVVAGGAAGASRGGGEGDAASEVDFVQAVAVAVDGAGNLFVADAGGGENTVRVVDRAGVITTAAGNGTRAFNGDGLRGPLSALNLPSDLAVDHCGSLLIADQLNDRVRRLNLVPPCPPAVLSAPAARGGRPFVPMALVGLAVLIGGAAATLVVRARSRPRSAEG